MNHGDIDPFRPIDQDGIELRDAARRLEAVTQLLDLATRTAYARRAQADADAAHGLLAFEIYLAGCRARRLVPADHLWTNDLIDGSWLDPTLAATLGITIGDASDKPVLQLLVHAEAQGRPLASWHGNPPESTHLVAELGALIREAERLDC